MYIKNTIMIVFSTADTNMMGDFTSSSVGRNNPANIATGALLAKPPRDGSMVPISKEFPS